MQQASKITWGMVFLGVLIGALSMYSWQGAILILLIAVLTLIMAKDTQRAVLLCVATIPCGIALPFITSVSIRVSYIILCIFIAAAIIQMINGKIKLEKIGIETPIFLSIAVIFLSGIQTRFISWGATTIRATLFNYPFVKSISRAAFLTLLIFFMYFLYAHLKDEEIITKSIRWYMLTAAAISVIGLLCLGLYFVLPSWEFGLSFDGMNTPRIKSLMTEPSFLGLFLVAPIAILLMQYIRKQETLFQTRTTLLLLAIIGITGILSFSRSLWLACVSIFGLVLINKSTRTDIINIIKQKKKIVAAICVIAIVSIIALSQTTTIVHDTTQQLTNAVTGVFDKESHKYWSTRTRLYALETALIGFKDHPLLGIGYANFHFYSDWVFIYGLFPVATNFPEINNLYIRIIAETGIIGALAFLLVCLVSFDIIRRRRKNASAEKQALIDGLSLSFLGMGIIYMFISKITVPFVWLVVTFMFAVANKWSDKEEEKRKKMEQPQQEATKQKKQKGGYHAYSN